MVRAPAFSDRQCEALTVCTTEQYQTVAATGASDRVCEDLTICTNAQYQTVPQQPPATVNAWTSPYVALTSTS